ncbi:hypothetical protein [Lederbergia lenta]|uniref:hypothetical protein n=1 Tax=Lederbergia lenta TaxID=1467 RepID=UPI00203DCC75|nr:hypothetical protein [Lederbergia lenta]MCM3109970.1 hypothetical protein [Lederbergia lenta]
MTKPEINEDDYRVVEIEGKHGEIHLHIPKREATQEEKDDLYRTVAEVIVNIYKDEKKNNNKE